MRTVMARRLQTPSSILSVPLFQQLLLPLQPLQLLLFHHLTRPLLSLRSVIQQSDQLISARICTLALTQPA